jgi:hypothetical protein
MSQYAFANTNASRPMVVLMAHDGDNYGGGTEEYYHENWDNFINFVQVNKDWIQGEKRGRDNRRREQEETGRKKGMITFFSSCSQTKGVNFECTTVEDYLARFPVPENDIIHVEDGSWSGENGRPLLLFFLPYSSSTFITHFTFFLLMSIIIGDPLFMKWNPDFFNPQYDPERTSWAVLTAGVNRILTANSITPWGSLSNILSGQGSVIETAWHYFLCGQASDYE